MFSHENSVGATWLKSVFIYIGDRRADDRSFKDGREKGEPDRVAVFSRYLHAFVKAECRQSESTTIAIRRLHSHG